MSAPKRDCDICDKINLQEYVGGRTASGPWANMCIPCFMRHGVGLGTGKGQMYRRSLDDSKWLDVTKYQTPLLQKGR
jgi:hypothetical protein